MKLNIRIKVILIVMALMSSLIMGIYFYLNQHLTEFIFEKIHTNLTRNALFVQSHIDQIDQKEDLAQKQWDSLADNIGKILNLRVTITDFKGVVLGDSYVDIQDIDKMENHLLRPEFQAALSQGEGESRRYSTTIHKDFLYMAVPFGKDRFKGFVRLSIPLSDMEVVSAKLRRILLNTFFCFFVLSTIVLGFFLNILIVKPIKEISSVTDAIAAGDFSKKIRLKTNNEIEDLANSINMMSEHIKTKIEEVLMSRSRLEAVFLSMNEGVMIIDKEGTILLMNETLKHLLNISGQPEGRKPLEVIRHMEIQGTSDEILRMPKGVITKEMHVLVPEEKILIMQAAAVQRDGAAEGGVLVFHDITELRHLEKIRQDFVANVSHELRTPISTIKGYAETLLDGALDDKANARDFVSIIHSDSDRLAKVVDDLLSLARIESGKAQFVFDKRPLKPIVERTVKALSQQAKEKSIDIRINIPQELPDVRIDEAGISQVFTNLIENAVKYNKSGGVVTISAEERSAAVEVSIADTGIGIPQEDIPRIFERFYRVDKARSREVGGTGLGLSIVKHILQVHQGHISVESTLGQGSVFIFSLPKA